MSLCCDCIHLDTSEGFTNCLNGHSPINSDCIYFLEARSSPNPLDVQIGGSHYKDFKIQPAEFNQMNRIPFLEGCVIKRMCRHKGKNGIEDLQKAKHEIDLIIKLEYGDE